MTTMTDTRAALDAAIRDLTDQIGCAPHHRDTLVATLDNRIAAHVTAEVARQTVTRRRRRSGDPSPGTRRGVWAERYASAGFKALGVGDWWRTYPPEHFVPSWKCTPFSHADKVWWKALPETVRYRFTVYGGPWI